MKRFALVLLVTFHFSGCFRTPAPPAAVPVAAPPAVPAAPAPTVQVKAGVGSGKAGRSLDPHEGIFVTPAKTYFSAKEKIVFEIQIPHTLNAFNALEGYYPRTHEEFMEKIIKANEPAIKLPELPEGHKYVYDPEKHELMVEKPAP